VEHAAGGGALGPDLPQRPLVFSRAEYEHFTDPANHTERNRTSFAVQADSVTPVVAAGLADIIDVDGSEVLEGVSFHPTPGHTFGHASIVLRSAGEVAMFPGDVMHAGEPARLELDLRRLP
jgi:glyoxylase-like metal-dependent hydrolase (beta-lactamase superfamily II)